MGTWGNSDRTSGDIRKSFRRTPIRLNRQRPTASHPHQSGNNISGKNTRKPGAGKVAVAVGVGVTVGVLVPVAVAVVVLVAVAVRLGVGVAEPVTVGVGVAVPVGVIVGVPDGVGVIWGITLRLTTKSSTSARNSPPPLKFSNMMREVAVLATKEKETQVHCPAGELTVV